MSKRFKKYISLSLILSMVLSLIPGSWSGQAAAAGDDYEVRFSNGQHVGNLSYPADNTFLNFYTNVEGFKQTETDKDAKYDWANGDIFAGVDDNEATVQFEVKVADNPLLHDMALSGQAEVLTGFAVLRRHSGFLWTRHSAITVSIDGKNIINERTGSSQRYNKSATAIIKPDSVIKVWVYGEGDDDGEAAGVRGFYLKFQDLKRPVLNSYTFTGNGAERMNTNINQKELYVKRDENITLSYNFTEPVQPSTVVPDSSDYFLRHKLFISEDGTGLPAAGEQQYLTNSTYTNAEKSLKSYQKQISYKYTGVPFHNSGNLPLKPVITGGTTGGAPMDMSMENKLKQAVLSDAAGNKATVNLNNLPSSGSNSHLSGKNVNPFDFDRGGFRVIIDAVRPKYTKTANGIQPEILTGVTLNKGDVIDFTLQLTEEAIIKNGWDENKTFILFNNGMKAYYVTGRNTKNWTFRMTVPDGLTVETPLLKAIAVSNDVKGGALPVNMDTDVIQDYAGNLMIQPANYDGLHEEKIKPYGSDISLANSKIDWANLFIDNTKPVISYRYEAEGASNTAYAKKGKVTIDANDPSIKVPHLDPTEPDRGAERPSRGIYRPSNMSAEASPSVGLVYYWWSQDKADPFASVSGDNNAALKRYALSAKQPSEELYPGEFQNIQLSVVNNKTNLLSPPPEAFEAGNSGEWYLHTWTADMTWDSARELMQYEKKKAYVASHQAQYDAWKAEATGSEADKIFYADNQALAAVGQYGDLNVWTLADFKHDDSNWTHAVGTLKLDNLGPTIKMAAEDNTTVQALVQDPHSGVKEVQYQWVKDGQSTDSKGWAPAEYVGTTVTRSTYEDIDEDGAYWLYLKAVDNIGNETIKTPQEKAIVVNSEATIPTQFLPEANPDYVKSHDVTFQISGVTPGFVGYAISSSSIHPESDSEFTGLEASSTQIQPKVNKSSLEGADGAEAPAAPVEPESETPVEPEVTASIGPVAILKLLSTGPVQPSLTPLAAEETPAPQSGAEPTVTPAEETPVPDNSAEPTATPAAADAESTEEAAGSELAPMSLNVTVSEATYSYVVPVDPKLKLSGTQYIHMMVKHSDRTYYYSKAYYFDNEAPAVTLSINSIAYPLPEQKTRVNVSEFYSKKGLVSKYKWVKQETGAEVPTQASAGWLDLPSDGAAVINGKALKAGEIADYKVYVLATDGAGNSSVTASTGTFKVSASSKPETPPTNADSSLIYLSGDGEDGYTAIVKLSLETDDKAGYEYSVSPDNGTSWINWKPYTNFVAVKVPTGDPQQLQVWVKYRTPGGLISEAAKLDIKDASTTVEPVYALAALSTNGPVNAKVGADIEITLPPGIRVMPSKINPSEPVRTGNKFKIYENGFYSFDLTDLSDTTRTDTLYLVVKNIDGTAPEGTVEYSNDGPTNNSVTAYLQSTSEPVTITNNGGKNSYIFKENGTFIFEIKDAAGNINTVEAKAENINKEAPKVKVVRSYQYGLNGGSTFNTVKDNGGNVLFSTGMTLTVEKADHSEKQIKIISQDKSITMTENGTASFTVLDNYGNTAVIKEKVDSILSSSPEVGKITYTFVDAAGKAVPADQIVAIGGQKYAKGKVKVTLSGTVAAPNKMFFGVRPISDGAAYSNQISGADGTFSYSRAFESSGSTVVAISDLLGNVNKVPVTIAGLDNTPPELTLNNETAGIVQNKKDFNFRTELGGFTVSDNVSDAANVKVSISGLDLSKLGRQRVAYAAVDQVGNKTVVYQDVVVVKDGGLLVFGNDTLISASSGESALFNTNILTFKVTGYNIMKVAGVDKVNQAGTFDILYYPGLYREGQLKLVKQKLTYNELVNSQFKVTFPKTGWYTIVVRTQERDREFATFFVGNTK